MLLGLHNVKEFQTSNLNIAVGESQERGVQNFKTALEMVRELFTYQSTGNQFLLFLFLMTDNSPPFELKLCVAVKKKIQV